MVKNVDLKNVKEKIALARKAVEGEEEPYKTEAFKIIFSKLLGTCVNSGVDDNNHSTVAMPKGDTSSKKGGFETKKTEFATICGIDAKEIDNVFYVKDNEIRLVSPLSGNETEKQIKASTCILLAYEVLFGKTWLSSLILSKSLDLSGVGNLTNLADNLKRNSDLFRKSGTKRATEYKITGPGRTKAIEIIKKVAKAEIV